ASPVHRQVRSRQSPSGHVVSPGPDWVKVSGSASLGAPERPTMTSAEIESRPALKRGAIRISGSQWVGVPSQWAVAFYTSVSCDLDYLRIECLAWDEAAQMPNQPPNAAPSSAARGGAP